MQQRRWKAPLYAVLLLSIFTVSARAEFCKFLHIEIFDLGKFEALIYGFDLTIHKIPLRLL